MPDAAVEAALANVSATSFRAKNVVDTILAPQMILEVSPDQLLMKAKSSAIFCGCFGGSVAPIVAPIGKPEAEFVTLGQHHLYMQVVIDAANNVHAYMANQNFQGHGALFYQMTSKNSIDFLVDVKGAPKLLIIKYERA